MDRIPPSLNILHPLRLAIRRRVEDRIRSLCREVLALRDEEETDNRSAEKNHGVKHSYSHLG